MSPMSAVKWYHTKQSSKTMPSLLNCLCLDGVISTKKTVKGAQRSTWPVFSDDTKTLKCFYCKKLTYIPEDQTARLHDIGLPCGRTEKRWTCSLPPAILRYVLNVPLPT